MRDKQIEEMAKLICSTCQRELDPCGGEKPCRSAIAESNDLYNAGYRKASDVAREVIADMREMIKGYENIDVYLDRIEKKYESEGEYDNT